MATFPARQRKTAANEYKGTHPPNRSGLPPPPTDSHYKTTEIEQLEPKLTPNGKAQAASANLAKAEALGATLTL
jgi:hypothetical protein